LSSVLCGDESSRQQAEFKITLNTELKVLGTDSFWYMKYTYFKTTFVDLCVNKLTIHRAGYVSWFNKYLTCCS